MSIEKFNDTASKVVAQRLDRALLGQGLDLLIAPTPTGLRIDLTRFESDVLADRLQQ